MPDGLIHPEAETPCQYMHDDCPKFAIAGVAGYVAPKHMKAIHDIGGKVVVAHDPHDSVGILDRYFPEALFTTDPKKFWRILIGHVDYLVCCAPNDEHAFYAMEASRWGIKTIVEKPLCLTETDYQNLTKVDGVDGAEVSPVLQLRLHHEIVALRSMIGSTTGHKVSLRYVTQRGPWYMESWKGDPERSGGLAMNIGIHLFDMLIWVFGSVKKVCVEGYTDTWIEGTLTLEGAEVDWLLSTDHEDVPKDGPAERSMVVDGNPVVFTGGFEDLHTEVYKRILNGDWYSVVDAGPALALVREINEMTIEQRFSK